MCVCGVRDSSLGLPPKNDDNEVDWVRMMDMVSHSMLHNVLLITLSIGLVSSVTSRFVTFDCLSSQLFVLSGLSGPVELHSCGL